MKLLSEKGKLGAVTSKPPLIISMILTEESESILSYELRIHKWRI